jgi:Ca-activated chloride channel family protein
MHFVKLHWIWLMGCLFAPISGQGQSSHSSLRKGDQAYLQSKYAEAETAYREALTHDPGSEKAAYNLGNSIYRQGKYAEAEKTYQSAAQSVSTTDRADALHNLGNSLMQQEKYKEAVAAYQNSLRLRPGDAGSKRNLQMAKQRLKEQQEQEKQQQKQPPPQQNQPSSSGQQPPSEGAPPEQPSSEPSKGRLPASKQQFLESIGREDQRNKQKYQEYNTSQKPRTRTKDW